MVLVRNTTTSPRFLEVPGKSIYLAPGAQTMVQDGDWTAALQNKVHQAWLDKGFLSVESKATHEPLEEAVDSATPPKKGRSGKKIKGGQIELEDQGVVDDGNGG